MPALSVFSDREVWDVLVRLVNDEDEGAAIEAYRRLLVSRGYRRWVPQGKDLPPSPVIGSAVRELNRELNTSEVKADLPNMRLLLRWVADPVGRVGDKETVVQILNDRRPHYGRFYGPFPGGRPAEQTPLQVQAVFGFDRPIDLVASLVAEQFAYGHSDVATMKNLRPIRTCRSCGKLFVRNRKSQFCQDSCKVAFYNRGPRRADAAYQFERRMLKLREGLSPKRFREVVKLKLSRIERRPDGKRARIRFLEGLLPE